MAEPPACRKWIPQRDGDSADVVARPGGDVGRRWKGRPSVCGRWLRDDDVVTAAAVERVAAASAFESVVAGAAEQLVAAGVPDQRVVAIVVGLVAHFSENRDGACDHETGVDDVIAFLAHNLKK